MGERRVGVTNPEIAFLGRWAGIDNGKVGVRVVTIEQRICRRDVDVEDVDHRRVVGDDADKTDGHHHDHQ